MAGSGERSSGGISIRNVGGDVRVEAGGDMVGRDKVVTANGFASEQDRAAFGQEVELLRELLRELKSHVEQSAELGQDDRDELVSEVMHQLKGLKTAREDASEMEPGAAPEQGRVESVTQHLDAAGGLLEKLQGIAQRTGQLVETAAPLVARGITVLAAARHLLGLP